MKHIEILSTLGPSSLNKDIIIKLSQQGVTLFRINLSHTPIDKVESTIKLIQMYSSVPICLDSEGAQIRNQSMKDGEVNFKKGAQIKIHFTSVIGDENNISFTPDNIAPSLQIGDIIEIDFHATRVKVNEVTSDYCKAEVLVGGIVGSNKATDINRNVFLEAITEKDKEAIEIGKKMGVTNYALSFANCRQDVESMRLLIGKKSKLISKIESIPGLSNLENILEATDAILIDRGDLSRQVPIEKIPFLQRKIISVAKYHQVPVYVATNLLESMILMNQPTRAEVNDVISTIFMGADGLVLAAETAIGRFPVETVVMVNKLLGEYKKWTPNTNISEIVEKW